MLSTLFMDKIKLFICHASEDKKDFVIDLAEALSREFSVWLDRDSLIIGPSLLEQIDKGLAETDHGVVILSPHFFAKAWPRRELDGLLALEEKNKKAILPIWKDIDFEGVRNHSAILASRFAAKASDGVEKVVNDIKRAVAYFDRGKSVEILKPGKVKLQAVLQKHAEKIRSDAIVSSMEGVHLGVNIAITTINLLRDQVQSIKSATRALRVDGTKEEPFGPALTVSRGGLYLHAEYQNDVINSARTARLLMILGQNTGDAYMKLTESKYSIFIDANDDVYWLTGDGKGILNPEEMVDMWLGKFADQLDRI